MGIGADLSRRSSAPWGSIVADRIETSVQEFTIEPRDNLQAVLDSISSGRDQYGAFSIGLMPGVYRGLHTLARSFVRLYAVFPGTAIIERDPAGPLDDTPALRLFDPVSPTTEITDVEFDGLTFVNSISTAPAPTLSIGFKLGTDNGRWNRIVVKGCRHFGNHDCLQIWGAVTNTGRLTIVNNLMLAAHDILTVKGSGRIYSKGNVLEAICDPGQGPSPWVAPAAVTVWKTTGIHINFGGAAGDAQATDEFVSVGDSIRLYVRGLIGTAGQDSVSGIFLYRVGPGSVGRVHIPQTRIVNPQIFVDYDVDYSPANGVNGIHVTNDLEAPEGQIIVSGGSITVHQRNAGASAPASVHGVWNNVVSTNPFVLKIVGTEIHGTNAKGGGTVASLRTGTDAEAQIKASVYSEHATVEGSAASINPATIQNT